MTDKLLSCRAFTAVRTAALNPSCQLHMPDLRPWHRHERPHPTPSASITCGISCIIDPAACLEAAQCIWMCREQIYFSTCSNNPIAWLSVPYII